ncbi:hypothetical protein [Fusibacter sp. 3D3]|uniref:hypothetical protein n=1 Tax=Fusibacter sp. 3D3 TaxID=1048380 RepID=UPI001112F4FC|nr:hypothetical protein [Fusibacter sp. 3D3]
MFFLLTLSVGTLYSANTWVNGYKTAIEIKETTLFGDKSAATGITIESLTHYANHLFWETQFTTEDPLELTTAFTFSQARKNAERTSPPQMMLSSNIDFGMSGNGLDLEAEQSLALKPAADVATRTPNGEMRTETVLLSDYYAFYPLSMDVDTPNGFDNKTHTAHIVTNYFQIPVPKRHMLDVSVTKSSTGQLTTIDTQSISGSISLYAESLLSSSGYYYIIKSYDEHNGNSMVLPHKVSGIHFLPFQKVGGISEPNLTHMNCVYTFENETVRALSLMQDVEDQTLLLITEENDVIMLSVIDQDSMTLIQKTEITKASPDVSFSEIKSFGDFLVAYFSDQRFYLLSKTADRHYELQMSENFPEIVNMAYMPFDRMQMTYAHDRLAIAFYKEQYKSSLYLIVYDKTGLAYVGQYDQNTDRTPERQNHKNVVPLDQAPLRITFIYK